MDGRTAAKTYYFKPKLKNENPFFIRRTSDAYLYDPENGTSKSGTRIITAGCLSALSPLCIALCTESAALVDASWASSCARTPDTEHNSHAASNGAR